jgi:hypothetical protein
MRTPSFNLTSTALPTSFDASSMLKDGCVLMSFVAIVWLSNQPVTNPTQQLRRKSHGRESTAASRKSEAL